MNRPNPFAEKLTAYRSWELAKQRLKNLTERILPKKRLTVLELQANMHQEEQDVRQLEQLTISALFEKFLGDFETRYQLEKQEFMQAVLEYNEGVKELELLEFEENVLREKVAAGENLHEELRHLSREREEMVRRADPVLATQLSALNRQEEELVKERREVYEAILAGTQVLRLTGTMIGHLEAARQFEQWGGGSYAERQMRRENRQRRIDRAHMESFKIRPALVKFADELHDVNHLSLKRRVGASVEFEFFDKLYFDRLITDWVLRQRVDHSLQFLRSVEADVLRLVEGLKRKQKMNRQQLAYSKKRYAEVILGE